MNKLFYWQNYDVLGDYKAFQKVKSTKLIEISEYKSDCWINIDVGTGYVYSPVLLRLDDMKKFK